MSTYLDGLTVATSVTLWVLGALTPIILGYAVLWGLRGPLRVSYRQFYAWRHARRTRGHATRLHGREVGI